MAVSSTTGEQPKYGLRNDSDGLRIVLPASATGGQPKYDLGNDHGLRNALPTSPFDKLILSPTTSVASSSVTKPIPYDVFINHCGQDVKHTLASRIYDSLNATGLRVFLDKDELKLGDYFPRALEAAIRSASVHIAIFSEHYAQSPWCLAELDFMLQTGTIIIPIFYHVEPFTLRWAIQGTGMYANALSKYERKNRYTSELERWKQALNQASFYTGDIINNQGDEQRVLKIVVNRVMKELNKVPLEVAKHPVGLDEAVQKFDTVALQFAGSIQIIGIWGMGGSGKTTLAKEIFNRRCSTIDRSSFLFDVRDAAEKGLLVEKQKQLLEDLDVKGEGVSFDNVHKGKGILKSRLKSIPVLIILDDVDHTDQLDTLLPARETLGHGSLIVVTTRELNILKAWSISAIYEMKALNPTRAKQLFCWHAFLRPYPLSGFEDLVEQFLYACNGLPLSLEVLGGQLYGQSDKDYWQCVLDKLLRILPDNIKSRLKVSYDALDDENKEMFLDTACFFIGYRKSVAIAVWDGSGWSGMLGWETLFNKCLVKVDKDGAIRMHDQLRDLGRDIANRQLPYRLWSPKQTIQIHPQQEAIRIRGMENAIGDNCYPQQGKLIINTSLGKRSPAPSSLGLKIFVGDGDFINQEHGEISRELLWLQCNEFEHKNLPSWLSLKKLRILELFNSRSLEDLWESDSDAPLQLRELVIETCNSFRGFPRSIGHLKNLKKISICHDFLKRGTLSGLPQEFCHLRSLTHLEITWCANLPSLPSNFGELTNLQYLNLNGCTKLEMLPDSFKKLTLLEYLNLKDSEELIIKSELHILENMRKLKYLNLGGCRKLEELRLPEVASLTELYLDGTSLKELPANIIQLTMLTKLVIGSKFLRTLPNSLGILSSLTLLQIEGCEQLECLPDSLGNLSSLIVLQIQGCKCLTTLPTSFGNLSSLIRLRIHECEKLESLPDSLDQLNFLGDLDIESSEVKCLPKSFINLQFLKIHYTPIRELSFGSGCMLKILYLWDTEVSKISICGDCCPFLEILLLILNDDLRELETLPANLKILYVYGSHVLKDIRGVRGLKKLNILKIKFCEELDGFPSLAGLTSLKELHLEKCYKLEKVEGLESLRSLKRLYIRDCKKLDGLPSLAELNSLEEFNLSMCTKMKIEGLERLRSLEKLEVHAGIGFGDAPDIVSLEQCERLKSLVVASMDSSPVEPFISNIQKWPREVIICTRPMFEVGSLENFFTSLNVSVIEYVLEDDMSDILFSKRALELRRPENSANANVILICFIIDCFNDDFNFRIVSEGCEFRSELGPGKWVWMGVFTQGSDWLRSKAHLFKISSGVKLEKGWLVMGEEGSIIEAFH